MAIHFHFYQSCERDVQQYCWFIVTKPANELYASERNIRQGSVQLQTREC